MKKIICFILVLASAFLVGCNEDELIMSSNPIVTSGETAYVATLKYLDIDDNDYLSNWEALKEAELVDVENNIYRTDNQALKTSYMDFWVNLDEYYNFQLNNYIFTHDNLNGEINEDVYSKEIEFDFMTTQEAKTDFNNLLKEFSKPFDYEITMYCIPKNIAKDKFFENVDIVLDSLKSIDKNEVEDFVYQDALVRIPEIEEDRENFKEKDTYVLYARTMYNGVYLSDLNNQTYIDPHVTYSDDGLIYFYSHKSCEIMEQEQVEIISEEEAINIFNQYYGNYEIDDIDFTYYIMREDMTSSEVLLKPSYEIYYDTKETEVLIFDSAGDMTTETYITLEFNAVSIDAETGKITNLGINTKVK